MSGFQRLIQQAEQRSQMRWVDWRVLVIGVFLCTLMLLSLYNLVPSLTPATALGLGCATGVLVLVYILDAYTNRERKYQLSNLTRFIENDPFCSLISSISGEILSENTASRELLGPQLGHRLSQGLAEILTNPEGVLVRLRLQLDGKSCTFEDVPTRRGYTRVSVSKYGGLLVWRIQNFDTPQNDASEDISLPIMTVNQSGAVLYVNDYLRSLLGYRPKRLTEVFDVLPLYSGDLVQVRGLEDSLQARVFMNEKSAGRREFVLFLTESFASSTPSVTGALFDSLPIATLQLSGSGHVEIASSMARNLLGIDGNLVPNVALSDLFEGLGRPLSEWVSDVAKGRIDTASEVLCIRGKTGEQFVQLTLGRSNVDGRAKVIGVLQDVSEAKRLETQAMQSQKMQAIGQLAGGIAHDFNNLLTAISGHCDLLLLNHSRDDQSFADVEQISQNANRAAALVGQLLAFSRKQTLQLETFYPSEILYDHLHLLRRLIGEKVRLNLDISDNAYAMRSDKRQFEQVIMNLVVNARDAMPDGGVVEVNVSPVLLKKPLVRDNVTVPSGAYNVISIEDEGCGIPPDVLSKIFEPFFTTKAVGEGTGLGLSMVYGIVKQSGGYVFANTMEGKGTTFVLYLPAADISLDERLPVTQSIPDPLASDHVAPKMTVLVVEDEDPVRAFTCRALRLQGHHVYEARNAMEALSELARGEATFELFITDVVMPGQDGPTWVNEAYKTHPNVPTIFMSGYSYEQFGEQNPAIRDAVYLAKPFSLNDLNTAVLRAVES